MHDVPWILDGDAVLRLEASRARPGDVGDPVGAFPHQGQLVDAFPGESSPEDEIACLQGTRAHVAAVVTSQVLLIFGRPEGGATS